MNNIYLVYGNSYELIKRRVNKIINDVKDVSKYDLSLFNVKELLDDALCISIFGDKKVVIGENALFLTASKGDINHDISYLESYINDDSHDNIVILWVISEKLDSKKKIVKLLNEKAKVYNEEEISDKDISSFVIKEFKDHNLSINATTANYFKEYVGSDIGIISNEIDKMILYKQDNKTVTTQDIDNISSKIIRDNIFEFTDGILKRNYKKIFECYNDLMKLNEDPVKLISMIASQFMLIYQVKILNYEFKSQKEIASILKVHPYRVKLAIENNYRINEIEQMIKKLHDLDYKIKSGKEDKFGAFEKYLLEL